MGIYHYNLRSHNLEILELNEKLNLKELFEPEWISQTSIVVVFAALFTFAAAEHSDRVYRNLLISAGRLGQSFYFASESLKLDCFGVEGFVDDKLNKLFDLDGFNEACLYAVAIGFRKN